MKPAHGAVATIVTAAALTLGVTKIDQNRARSESASAVIGQVDSAQPKAKIVGASLKKPEPAPAPAPAPPPAPVPQPVPMDQVTVVSWIDGDTFHGTYRTVVHFSTEIAMPWTPKQKIGVELEGVADIPVTVRCYGINTPESKGTTKAAGIASREYAKQLAPPGSVVSALPAPREEDKYGRWLVDVQLDDGRLFRDVMVSAGMGTAYFGGAR